MLFVEACADGTCGVAEFGPDAGAVGEKMGEQV